MAILKKIIVVLFCLFELPALAHAVIGYNVPTLVTPGQIPFGSPTGIITSTKTVTYNSGTDTVGVTNLTVNGSCSGCGGGGSGSGIVSPGTFTWTNNNGVIFSTVTASTITVSGEIILPDHTVLKSTSSFGTITGVTAGTGLTGGGTSGAITLTVDQSVIASRSVVATATATLQSQITATGVSTGTIAASVTTLGTNVAVSTNALQAGITAAGVSTGTLATNVAASTNTLSTAITTLGTNVAASTNTLETQINTKINFSSVTATAPAFWNNGTGVISVSAVSLSTSVAGTLPVANGGTGTASPGLIAGTNITSITGTWPNQTINAATQSGSSGGVTLSSFTATQPIVYNNVSGVFSSTLISATTGFTGTLQAAQEPAHSGDVTNSAGSLAMTAAATQANIRTFTAAITDVSSHTFNGVQVVSSSTHLSGSVGTNGQVYTSGGPGVTPTWTTPSGSGTKAPISFTFDGGGLVISSAVVSLSNFYEMPYSATISSYTLSCDTATTTINFSVGTETAANFAATVAPTSICASACPSLSSVRRKGDGTLSGWTTALNSTDYLIADLSGAVPTNAKRCLLQVWIQ